MVMIIEGLPYFAFPGKMKTWVNEGLPYFAFPGKMKTWVKKIIDSPETSLRRFGLVLMVLGLSLIYMGRS
jgi:uncharacterized protein YjeT (DUF2065 family)